MIVVGTTLAAFVMDQEDTWASWMRNAEAVKAHHPDTQYFAAIEVDARGLATFGPFIDRLKAIGGEYWTYSLDDGRTEVTTANRLRHLCFGENLCVDYAMSAQASHLLFMAADCMPPDDVMPRMLEMEHPVCAPYITTYGLRGPKVKTNQTQTILYPKDWAVEAAMPSAACIFIVRDVFRKIRWRWDFIDGSDDPCYYKDCTELLGVQPHVRHDVLAKHYPEAIGAIETRGHDMKVHR